MGNIESNKKVTATKELFSRLKNARKILSWQEFANEIKYDRTYLSRVLNGHEVFSEDLEEAIVKAFGKKTEFVGFYSAQEDKEEGNTETKENEGDSGRNKGVEQSITFTKSELIALFRDIAAVANEKAEKAQEKHIDFLQGLVNSNLKDTQRAVVDAHFEILSHLKAFERWEALRRTNGDKEKAKDLLAELGTIVGEVVSEDSLVGRTSTLSSSDIS